MTAAMRSSASRVQRGGSAETGCEYQAYLDGGGRIADHRDCREGRVAFASVSGDVDAPLRIVTLLRQRNGGPPVLDPGTNRDLISDGPYIDLLAVLLSATHHHLATGASHA
jgi:hypothetical protein